MRILLLAASVMALSALRSASAADAPPPTTAAATQPSPDAYLRIADEAEAVLRNDVLAKWFPAAVDRQGGGFFENFDADWTPAAVNDRRSVVYQSRLTWLAAKAIGRDPAAAAAVNTDYTEITRHGVAFLAAKQWDQNAGGFFWSVDPAGRVTADRPREKATYGIAFGIYAAATSYEATHDLAALDLARRAFAWLDQHAHDAANGGYFESLAPDGTPIPASRPGADAIGARYGGKSMNAHIHLLEALTALHHAQPDDATVRARLQEVFDVVRDKVYTEPGFLTMYSTPQWTRLRGHDSFGHDVETAYLLAEASAELGRPDDEQTWACARRLVDHALDVGYDARRGGFYNEGTVTGADLDTHKIWWVQAEGLNALLLMHDRFGRETPRYWQAFLQQWDFIKTHQIDPARGGWYRSVAADGRADPTQTKSDQWTEGYHQGRALMTVADTLRRLANPNAAAAAASNTKK